MKFFFNFLAFVNISSAYLGFSGRHRAQGDIGEHYESHEHESFHDHFAHALSVMRYYRQQRGRNLDFAHMHIRWKSYIWLIFQKSRQIWTNVWITFIWEKNYVYKLYLMMITFGQNEEIKFQTGLNSKIFERLKCKTGSLSVQLMHRHDFR